MAKKSRTGKRPSSRVRELGVFFLSLAIIAALVATGVSLLAGSNSSVSVWQPPEGCQVNIEGQVADIDYEQAINVSIIVGEALRRELPARAATIALTTAYQESNLYNLDYGDRDSLGLFQQRPSQGWGSEEQIMDPWYSAGAFYDALVKIQDWQMSDINDTAQEVQRSNHPQAYRKHEPQARIWASALTGYSPMSVSCLDRTENPANPDELTQHLTRIFGDNIQITTNESYLVEVAAPDETTGWALAQLSQLWSRDAGITAIRYGANSWKLSGKEYLPWVSDTTVQPDEVPGKVQIWLRNPQADENANQPG